MSPAAGLPLHAPAVRFDSHRAGRHVRGNDEELRLLPAARPRTHQGPGGTDQMAVDVDLGRYRDPGQVDPAQMGARFAGGAHSMRYHPEPVEAGRFVPQSSGSVTGVARSTPGGVADSDKMNCARVKVWTRVSEANKAAAADSARITTPVATPA